MTTIKASGRDLELRGDQDIVFYPTDNIWISQGTKLIFEGTVPDDHEAKLQATAVTADRDIIIPDASGTLTLNEKLTDGTFDMNVNSLTVTGSGATSVIQASQDIELDATGAVIVKDTPLRLASLTTTQRNALTPVNGDMIYNTTTNKIEMYTNGAWGSTATVEGLVDSAPGTLDTLNELAAALGDDPNFATTTANNIALKLNTADFTSTADTWLATKSTTNVSEGTNLYYTQSRFDTAFTAKSTTNLSEGTNLYYTDARARAAVSATTGSAGYNSSTGAFSIPANTSHVAESGNLYYTDARADARIANNIIDEDSMATNSATRAPSQQSVKAYVDANSGGGGGFVTGATISSTGGSSTNREFSTPVTVQDGQTIHGWSSHELTQGMSWYDDYQGSILDRTNYGNPYTNSSGSAVTVYARCTTTNSANRSVTYQIFG